MKIARLLPILTLCTILAACRIDASRLVESEEAFTVQIHHPGGRGITTRQIQKGDEMFAMFKKWMENNETGWEQSPVTFLPSVVVRGKKFFINYHQQKAIINFQDTDGTYHQYTKEIQESDFHYLLPK